MRLIKGMHREFSCKGHYMKNYAHISTIYIKCSINDLSLSQLFYKIMVIPHIFFFTATLPVYFQIGNI